MARRVYRNYNINVGRYHIQGVVMQRTIMKDYMAWRRVENSTNDIQELERKALFEEHWSLFMFKKRLEYVRKQIDLIYFYQDIMTPFDDYLFEKFCAMEKKLIEDLKKLGEL